MDNATKKVMSCCDRGKHSIAEGLEILSKAKILVGHNIIAFDLPAIRKLTPSWQTTGMAHDTLVLSRLYWPDIKDYDFGRLRKGVNFPKKLIGLHSLEAWGYRVGVYKGEFGKTTDWKDWSPEMQSYCEQDVEVTHRLYARLMGIAEEWGQESFTLEHQFAGIIAQQIEYGFSFDEDKAAQLYAKLSGRRTELVEELKAVFPPIDKGELFTPKVNNKTRGYVKGVPVWKTKLVEFNPSSRDHIAERLTTKYKWKPTAFTENAKPQIDETVLKSLSFPECPFLIEYLTVEKRIGQIAEGKQAWLKNAKKGRIHGGVTTNGAVTGRCTHHHPNIAQVPAVGAPYGEECRALFGPPKGYYQLGCDAAGLELRCLAHFITKYDGGAYRDVILHGDIHTANQKAAGLATRAEAKRFI